MTRKEFLAASTAFAVSPLVASKAKLEVHDGP